MRRHDRINNWDLVDRSAPYVVGGYLFDKPRDILYKLARSKNIIDRKARTPFRLRSEERNGAGVVTFQLNSAPPNGVDAGVLVPGYKHVTPNGVKPRSNSGS